MSVLRLNFHTFRDHLFWKEEAFACFCHPSSGNLRMLNNYCIAGIVGSIHVTVSLGPISQVRKVREAVRSSEEGPVLESDASCWVVR